LWRYFAWSNQTLAVFTLWAITVYLTKEKRFYGIALLPAMFMTAVSVSYILIAPEGFQLSQTISIIGGVVVALASFGLFAYKMLRK
jgi:carbon starvation protein CstA